MSDLLEAIAEGLHGCSHLVSLFKSDTFAWIASAPANEQLPIVILADAGSAIEYETDGSFRGRVKTGQITATVFSTSRTNAINLARSVGWTMEHLSDANQLALADGRLMRLRRIGHQTTLDPEKDQISGRDVWSRALTFEVQIEGV